LGNERAEEWRRVFSPATNLRWLAGFISLQVGLLFLLRRRDEPGPVVGMGGRLRLRRPVPGTGRVRRAWREHRRHELLDQLVRTWRERALKGEAPLSTAADPGQRSKEMRAHLAVVRDLEQAEASVPQRSPPSVKAFVYASVSALGAGALTFFVVIVAAALRAPVGVLVALVIAMPSFGIVGLILSVLASSRARAQHAHRMAVIGQMTSARLARFGERGDPAR
jgi:hypothetical protein